MSAIFYLVLPERAGLISPPSISNVAETMDSEVELRFSSLATDTTVFEGRGRHACLEVQGDLPAILDD